MVSTRRSDDVDPNYRSNTVNNNRAFKENKITDGSGTTEEDEIDENGCGEEKSANNSIYEASSQHNSDVERVKPKLSTSQSKWSRTHFQDDSSSCDSDAEEAILLSHAQRRTRQHNRESRSYSKLRSDMTGVVCSTGERRSQRKKVLKFDTYNTSAIQDLYFQVGDRDLRHRAERRRLNSATLTCNPVVEASPKTFKVNKSENNEEHNQPDEGEKEENGDSSVTPGSSKVKSNTNRRFRRRVTMEGDDEGDEKYRDLYSRVKRNRRKMVRDNLGRLVPDGETGAIEEDADDDEEDEEEDEEVEEEEEVEEKNLGKKRYSLRKKRVQVAMYQTDFGRTNGVRVTRRRLACSFGRNRSASKDLSASRNVAFRKIRRHSRVTHHPGGSDSTSSGTHGSSSDEEHFQKRKSKSMNLSRSRMLPMNFVPDDIRSGTLRDRQLLGASLADVDPMSLDRSIDFSQVGGLEQHVRSLKEMILFPLLYPEVFEHFGMQLPRGVLFYGPPGTGKTLVARALANECARDDGCGGKQRVAFFMRKGADCLSKWVGESERQLRLLFDQAYQMRPSIVFFDEIDGLAPVRSTRQDQIHSSIVSTLLALMDGLDSRGEVVVIGATNRLDALDPALRRPGRFDRELHFALPDERARRDILRIHMSKWTPAVQPHFIEELGTRSAGMCGADLRALCSEAVLGALRRRFPQIYESKVKLQLDIGAVRVRASDFSAALRRLVPAAQRSTLVPSRALSSTIRPLLDAQLQAITARLYQLFPQAQELHMAQKVTGQRNSDAVLDVEEDTDVVQGELEKDGKGVIWPIMESSARYVTTHRPRLLLIGSRGQGHMSHLGPALLHGMEGMSAYTLDLAALHSCSSRSAEEVVAQTLREARRTAPSVLYLPRLDQLLCCCSEVARQQLLSLLEDLEPSCPLLLLATATTTTTNQFDTSELADIFCSDAGETVHLRHPNIEERRTYFTTLFLRDALQAPPKTTTVPYIVEVLPVAPMSAPRRLSKTEESRLWRREEEHLRELRIFLRDIINKLIRDRRFTIFASPVDPEEVEDYYDIIEKPLDLGEMLRKIDMHKYQCAKDALSDIELITSNALEYNPEHTKVGREVRHRACMLKDTAYALIKEEMDTDFEEECEHIKSSREQRGAHGETTAPNFYVTAASAKINGQDTSCASNAGPPPLPSGGRYSKRLQKEAAPNVAVSPTTPASLDGVRHDMDNTETPATSSERRRSDIARSKRKMIWCRTNKRRRWKSRGSAANTQPPPLTSDDVVEQHTAVPHLDLAFNGDSSKSDEALNLSDTAVYDANDASGHLATELDEVGLCNGRRRHQSSHSPIFSAGTNQVFGINEGAAALKKRRVSALDTANDSVEDCSSTAQCVDVDERLSSVEHELARLLTTCIVSTEGWCVEALERLRAQLAQAIYDFRFEPDKTKVVQALLFIISNRV